MEWNFSQVQKDFKFSKYKGHPTIKITVPPSPPPPLQLSLIIKWYNHFRSLTWKPEVNILCTCTKHVSISHHLHSYEKVCLLIFLCNFTRIKLRSVTEQLGPSLITAQIFQPETFQLFLCKKSKQYASTFCRRKGVLTVRSCVEFFNCSDFVTFFPLTNKDQFSTTEEIVWWKAGNYLRKWWDPKLIGCKSGDYSSRGRPTPLQQHLMNS